MALSGGVRRRRGWAPPAEESFDVPAFLGMRDQRSPTYKPGEMEAIYNLMPEHRDRPGAYFLRAGFKRFLAGNNPGSSNAVQIAATVKWAGTVHFPSAVTKHIVVAGSTVYSLDFAAQTATVELTSGQITGAGANIAGFNSACPFHNLLIFATGGGKPWKWDGTTGGGITVLANAPSGVSLATVYAGKLFFRKSDELTIVWSEELDETLGYETAPYNNSWTVTQSNQTPIRDIAATEGGLFLFRAIGIGLIRGEVDANFSTTATRDDISTSLHFFGPTTPMDRACPVDAGVLFFDANARPFIWRFGAGLVPLWDALPRTFYTNLDGAQNDGEPWGFDAFADTLGHGEIGTDYSGSVTSKICYYDVQHDTHVFVLDWGGTPLFLHYDAVSSRLISTWVLKTSELLDQVAHFPEAGVGLPETIYADTAGYLYWTDTGRDNQTGHYWRDENHNSSGQGVRGVIIGPPHGWDLGQEWQWTLAEVVVDYRTSLATSFAWVTSHRHKGSLAAAEQTVQDAGLSVLQPFERRQQFGIDALGRWLRPWIELNITSPTDERRPGIFGYRLVAQAVPPSLAGN